MPTRNSRPVMGQDRLDAESAGPSREGYSFKARFGALIAATGVAGVPRALCHYLGELGLSYADLGFVTHVLSYRWTTAFPFPAQRKLAEQAGIGRTGIQRRVYALQALGYLTVAERFDQRDGRRTSNGYDFTPLLDRLNEFILRDWETVWKHRDPLVSDGEEEPADPQTPVDNRGDRPQDGVGERRQKWVGGHSQKAAGPGPELGADLAHKSGPEKDLMGDKDTSANMKQRGRKPNGRNSNLRTTTTTITLTSDQFAQSVGNDSRALDAIVDEYSDQFDDSHHVVSNRSRVRRLWQQTTLPIEDFIRSLADAAARTTAQATQVENAMPYFFGVLKGVLRERGFEVTDGRPNSGVENSVLEQLRRELSKRIRPDLAHRWLDGASLVEWLPGEERCILGVTDVDGMQKLDLEYSGLLRRAVAEVAEREVRVQVVLLGKVAP